MVVDGEGLDFGTGLAENREPKFPKGRVVFGTLFNRIDAQGAKLRRALEAGDCIRPFQTVHDFSGDRDGFGVLQIKIAGALLKIQKK